MDGWTLKWQKEEKLLAPFEINRLGNKTPAEKTGQQKDTDHHTKRKKQRKLTTAGWLVSRLEMLIEAGQ